MPLSSQVSSGLRPSARAASTAVASRSLAKISSMCRIASCNRTLRSGSIALASTSSKGARSLSFMARRSDSDMTCRRLVPACSSFAMLRIVWTRNAISGTSNGHALDPLRAREIASCRRSSHSRVASTRARSSAMRFNRTRSESGSFSRALANSFVVAIRVTGASIPRYAAGSKACGHLRQLFLGSHLVRAAPS